MRHSSIRIWCIALGDTWPCERCSTGWKGFFTYRVSDNNSAASSPATPAVPRAQNSNQNWTIKTGAGAFDIASLNSPTTGGFLSLQIDQRDSAGTIATIAYNAAVVIYSHGKNGFGAATVKGMTNSPPVGADEIINNAAGTTRFISRDITDSSVATGGAYDDIVAYLTPQDLLQPLVNEGTLKTCVAYCPFTFNPSCTSGTFSCTSSSGTGVCANSGAPPTCTDGSTHCTSSGTPQCLAPTPPTTSCAATGIPIGSATATCP